MRRYIERIVIPFITNKCEVLKLPSNHPALALFDGFKGQTTDGICHVLSDNHISFVLIPANCTDKFQPLDIAINKPLKDELKWSFQSWYAEEVRKQLEEVSISRVNIDVGLTVIKNLNANWIISAWQSIQHRPQLTIYGFKEAGILDAIERHW